MDSSASEPLSKRARKRVEKQEKMKELREQKKLKKLAEKEEKGAEKSEEHEIKPYQNEIKWEPLPFEGPAFLRQDKKVKLQESFRKGCSGVTIAIDCAFESYMNESEKISMYQQLAYSYSSNKDTAVPCKIALCGLQPFLHTRLKQHKADVAWNTWNCSVSTDPIESIYPIEKLVYLSADADTVLDTLEEDKVYVIGGIVDRNRHKGLCASKAKSLGIKTAKFPLDVYFEKVGFSRVLTTNHCVDVLHEFLACGNWMQACKRGVPVRKLKTRTRKRRMDTGENENAEEEDDSDDEGEEVAESSVKPLPSEAEDVSERKSSTLASGPQRHALLWGGINDSSRRICEILIEAGWTVLLTVPDVPSGTLFLRDFNASHANRNGELIITTGELGRIGDLLRVKEVVFKRLERRLDAVIFCQDSFESEEYESTHVTAVSDFVRELFRLWTGEGRTVPRFIFGDNLKHSPSQMMQLLDALRPRLLSSVDFTSSKTELLERVVSLKDSAAITWVSTNPSTTTS